MQQKVILAFLQNQWFKDPEGAKRVFANHPDKRNQLIATYLFMGCLTGRRLQQVFGEELCDQIIWEECSPEVGGKSSAAFPADIEHIKAAVKKHSPDVILAFGKIACDAIGDRVWLQAICGKDIALLFGPHPAARSGALWALNVMKQELDHALKT